MTIWIAGSPEQVIEAAKTGLVSAVVTNPTVIASWTQHGESLESVAQSVVQATRLPLYVQLHGPTRQQFLRETEHLKRVSDLIIPKIPATLDGLAAARDLEASGTETLITTVCSLTQAYVCAVAGVTSICPYFSRLRDSGENAAQFIADVSAMYRREGIKTRIRPASVRSVQDVEDCLLNGADGVIIFYDLFRKLIPHPVTDTSLTAFEADWQRTTVDPDYPTKPENA
ncbi:MAG: hypothetical protein H7319_04370 [Spirosoma sp.]|nr:hypothetical protein [Spirosoma sp.]